MIKLFSENVERVSIFEDIFSDRFHDIENKLPEDPFNRLIYNNQYSIRVFESVILILKSMSKYPDFWDQACPLTLQDIGEDFFQSLSNKDIQIKLKSVESILNLFLKIYQFYVEACFISSTSKELNGLEGFGDSIKEFAHCIDADEIWGGKNYATLILQIEQKINNLYIREVTRKQNETIRIRREINNIQLSLEETRNKYKFVELNVGFTNLASQRRRVVFWQSIGLIIGAAIILYILTNTLTGLGDILSEDRAIGWPGFLLPLLLLKVTLVVIILYFFRVLLSICKSNRNELSQIELRVALVQFIEAYLAVAINYKGLKTLDCFDNLIFSNLQPDSAKIPTTFDGVEQLANLVNAFKHK